MPLKKIIPIIASLSLIIQSFFLFSPPPLQSAALTDASVTLSNSRLSFYAKVDGTLNAGNTTINIQTSSNADNNTNHLFPNDVLSVGPNPDLTVSSIIDSDTFTTDTVLSVGASDGDSLYATQSGAVTISFDISSQIPANGYIRVTIPDPATNGNDSAPDTAASAADNGWDLNGITTNDVSVSGGTGCTWNGTETITPGSGSGHTIDATTTSTCTGGTITMTIDTVDTTGLINPAPVTSGHTQGVAESYQWTISTYDDDPAGSGSIIDTVDVSVAPIEAVLVSATIDETLGFSVTGITADSGATGTCGITRTTSSPDSTATSIPWGTLSTTYLAATHNASQLLEVDTNASGGYAVTVTANDEMGKDGKTCPGAADADDDCIQYTTCNISGCTHSSPSDWGSDPSDYPGLGYSLEEVTTDAAQFEYNDSSSTFYARQFADPSSGEDPQTIMSESSPVEDSQVYVCYRIDVPATQPAGYYYNIIKYTATATF